jgi:hypothetical protein
MKFLKNTLAIVTLLAIVSVDAKHMGKAKTTPAPAPIKTSESPAQKHLEHNINTHQNFITTHDNKFTQDFIKSVQSSKISNQAKRDLLEMAADSQSTLITNCRQNMNHFEDEMDELDEIIAKEAKIEESGSSSSED